MVPATYQLGLWRVQYLQQSCCICHINEADSIAAQPSLSVLPKFLRLSSNLVCDACHQDMTWLPSHTLLPLNISNSKSHAQSLLTTEPSASFKVQSAVLYDGYMRAALIAFKYKEAVEALPILVHALRQLPRPRGCHAKNSVILAVPTTANRLRSRGFDPTFILAYYLSKHWGLPLWQGVHRIDNTVRQQGLSRHQRHLNINEAFQVIDTPTTKRIIIFDDVITTGVTLIELIDTLMKAYPKLQLSAYTLLCQK